MIQHLVKIIVFLLHFLLYSKLHFDGLYVPLTPCQACLGNKTPTYMNQLLLPIYVFFCCVMQTDMSLQTLQISVFNVCESVGTSWLNFYVVKSLGSTF